MINVKLHYKDARLFSIQSSYFFAFLILIRAFPFGSGFRYNLLPLWDKSISATILNARKKILRGGATFLFSLTPFHSMVGVA
jgi:hypothetical protein